MIAYLSLGTNIGDKKQNLRLATQKLNGQCGSVLKESSVYETKAWGFNSENYFYNTVVEIDTKFSPRELLKQLFVIEAEIGRVRINEGYSDRIIDIDILFYEKDIIDTDELQVPHPLLQARNFVLHPMAEINPNYTHSKFNKSIHELMLDSNDISEIIKLNF